MGVSFAKGRWRCHHGSAAKKCNDCIWEHGYVHGMWVAEGSVSKEDKSALVNIRMEIVDAAKHYTKPMHRRMVSLIDRLMGKAG